MNTDVFTLRNVDYSEKGVEENYLYFGGIAVAERGHKKDLFVVLIKKTNINVVWSFYQGSLFIAWRP